MKSLLIALLTFASISAQAYITATEAQTENAKRAAMEIVENIGREKEGLLLANKAGWRLAVSDPNDADQKKFFQVIPIQMFSRTVNRIAVRLSLHAFSPEGKITWFAGGNYRILVDLRDNGEVIAAELNFFDNLMSYEEIAKPTPAHE